MRVRGAWSRAVHFSGSGWAFLVHSDYFCSWSVWAVAGRWSLATSAELKQSCVFWAVL